MIRVLVVDDDFMVARIHQGFLERVESFEVVGMAHSGAEALAAVARKSPDLVLLDLYLADMFGLDVVARLRAEGHTSDVIVISAAKDIDSVRSAMRHGVVDYVLKPFSFGDLRARLEDYAASRERLDEARVSGQGDIDPVLGRRPPPRAAVDLPKGMSPETAQLAEQALREATQPDSSLSASECAESLGVSRVSARRYLEHFVTTGRAEVSLRYGSTGRPERRYRWLA